MVDDLSAPKWRPIETAPKDGTVFLGCRPGWDYPILVHWKTNDRIPEDHPTLPRNYFGDLVEMDDYELAGSERVTYWLAIPPIPEGNVRG